MQKKRRRMRWESQLVLLTLAGGLPALILSSLYLGHAVVDPSLRGLVVAALWLSWLVGLRLAGASGRWELRRGQYIQDGRPHELAFLSDVSRALREEEREAWQRLIRVLSHEINNSLAPIQSIAGSLRALLARGAS